MAEMIMRRIPLGKRIFFLYYPADIAEYIQVFKLGPDAYSIIINKHRGFVICRTKRFIHCETARFSTFVDNDPAQRYVHLPNRSSGKITRNKKGRFFIYLFSKDNGLINGHGAK